MFMFTFLLAGGLRHYSMSYASRSLQLSYSSHYFMFVSFLFGGSVANPSRAADNLCTLFVCTLPFVSFLSCTHWSFLFRVENALTKTTSTCVLSLWDRTDLLFLSLKQHIKDNKNGEQVNFSFSKIWWASKVSLLAIRNDCVARSYRFSVPLTCTRAIIRQKVYCNFALPPPLNVNKLARLFSDERQSPLAIFTCWQVWWGNNGENQGFFSQLEKKKWSSCHGNGIRRT